MNEDAFWQLIEDCRPAGSDPDSEQLAAALTEHLARSPLPVVTGFAEQLSLALYRLDRREPGPDLSGDAFLWARAPAARRASVSTSRFGAAAWNGHAQNADHPHSRHLLTLVQMQPRPVGTDPAHRPVTGVMDAAGPQVCDDMSVEVALAVMSAARTQRPIICDQDGQCTGLFTRAQLAAAQDRAAYTDHVRPREILDGHGSFASPTSGAAETRRTMRRLRIAALPVVGEQGGALGVLALSH
ncbi:DUF4240 domain-containing protein [Streptomyces sp. NPDC016845]|uniref:DUF4240 domain-containing protein n=1 Tax=Streptomyces sp. NPDC016845 TaxID=3364972 RepID=UPI0037A436DF